MSDICKVFDNLYMQWMCIWMCPNNIPAAPADKASGSQLVNKWWWSGVIEAVDPIKIDPTSMSDTCKVFDNLHMQWMWIWMRHNTNNIPAAHADQALGCHLEIWVTPGQQMMVKCSDWGCRPNQDWSHINVRHMQGVWQLSYAVDVNMDESLQHYGCSHWPSFGQSPRNLGNSWATNDGEVQWLRL